MNKHMVKKEFHESLYESKGIWMVVTVAVILSGFCLLVMNMKAGSVLSQTDVIQYAIKIGLSLSLTVCMILGASSMIAEREENTLESLLLTPIPKKQIAFGKYVGVFLIGILLLLASVPYLIALGVGSGIGGQAIFLTFFNGILLLISFVSIAMTLSILMKSSKASVIASILIMIMLTMPPLLKSFLKLSTIGNFILKIDPVACSFNMMEQMLTNKVSFFSLGKYIIPLVIFDIVTVVILYFASNKISLKGEQ